QRAFIRIQDERGGVTIDNELVDPRFRQPYGGRYWQVSSEKGVLLRSRSLWDTSLQVDEAPQPGAGIRRQEVAGPDRQVLYAAIRSVILQDASHPPPHQRSLLLP